MDELLKIYDLEVRANPAYPDIVPVRRSQHFVSLEGPLNFMSYWNIPEENSADIIQKKLLIIKATTNI
jgi:hypothetical protein